MFYEPRQRDKNLLPHDPFKAIVTPRPIGWISTRALDGRVNLAPYSFFNAFSTFPAIVGFSSEGMKDSATFAIASGEFVEVEPPHRVVFTWGWEGEDSAVPPGSSTVEVTLTPQGEHTTLRLIHRDLPNPQEATGHTAGWDHYLERLQILGAGGDPGADAWAQEDRRNDD